VRCLYAFGVVNTELERRLYLNALRRRAEEGERRRPKFVDDFYRVTGVRLADDAFLSLEEGTALSRAAYQRQREMAPDMSWSSELERHIYPVLDEVAEATAVREAYLVGSYEVGYYIGYPLVPVSTVLRVAREMWEPIKEDFSLVTADAQDGLLLEFDECVGYELTTWGAFAEALRQ
jgi:hypothetical protein